MCFKCTFVGVAFAEWDSLIDFATVTENCLFGKAQIDFRLLHVLIRILNP